MKKLLIYFVVCVAIVVTGCTDFGKENQLTLPAAPTIDISNIVAVNGGAGVTFTVTPAGQAGYYSWLIVKSDTATSSLQAVQVLKLQVTGVAKGSVQYTDTTKSKTVTVSGLTPFTVYQIYAVASSPDGVVGVVKNANIRTGDDGAKPTPKTVAIAGKAITLTFSEPLKRGTGKVFVSYFAINTLKGPKLTVIPGLESFNPQDIEIASANLSISGSALVIQLPTPPAGVYASITYDAGAVLDLSDNACNAYTAKADTLVNGAPSRGITQRVAVNTWALHSEFVDNPKQVKTFAVWDELVIPATPDDGVTVGKTVISKIPTVIYREPGKVTTVDVKDWGPIDGVPSFVLPEEPARGATVDLVVPAGAFEDVYGNTSLALTIAGNYLYSYGYTMADVVGTYDIAMVSYFDGPLTETGIVIDQKSSSDNATVLIKNLFDSGTVVEGKFNPVSGTITLATDQILIPNADFGKNGIHNLLLSNADDDAPIVLNVPSPGTVTSPAQWWGYYVDTKGWYDVFSESTWTRTSADVASVAAKAAVKKALTPIVRQQGRKLRK